MHLTGYLIEKYNNMADAYTCRRLVEEAEKEDIELKIIGIHDTCILNGKCLNDGKILEKRDFVINRYKTGKLKDAVNSLAEKTYNPLEAYKKYINKYEQVKNISSDSFLIPKYILAASDFNYEILKQELKTPFVAKGLESSQGREIFLINNEEEYKKLKDYFGSEKEILFEEFISSSVGRDMRFYSIRGNVKACMVRESQGDFRANVALGASVRKYEITPEIKKAAEDIYKKTKLDFLGIDLMFGEDKPYFCEINVMPGIEGIEKASGMNVAEEIIKTIKNDFSKEVKSS